MFYQNCLRLVGILALWGLSTVASAQRPANLPPEVIAYADTVFYNGKVYTADEKFTVAEAVAIRDGKFLALGTSQRILQMAGPQTRKIDLQQKRSLVPAFWDTHFHIDDGALSMMLMEEKNIQWEGQSFHNALHWKDVLMGLRDIEKAVRAAQPGELVWVEVTIPTGDDVVSQMTMAQLNTVAPQNPLLITGPVRHNPLAANSLVYQKLVPMPPGTEGLPRGTSAAVTGEAYRRLLDYVRWAVPMEVQIPWQKKVMRIANSWGLVGVDTRVEPGALTAIREIWAAGEMSIRLRAAIQVLDAGDPEKILRAMGNLSDIGDDMLKITGIGGGSAVGGGGIGTGEAWTFDRQRQPVFPDQPYGRGGWREGSREQLLLSLRYGWNVNNSHVVGDHAVAEYVKALEEGMQNRIVKSKTQRLTIDHTPMARPEEIRKMKELGIMPSISSWHLFVYGRGEHIRTGIDQAVELFGRERVHQMVPIKSYIDMGIRPALEADVIDDPVGKPLWKIQQAVTRKDHHGQVWGPQEKITRQQALWMSTIWPAEHCGDGKKLGSIEVEKLADLVVLDGDYMSVPEDEISKIPVAMTVVGGKVVYEGD